MTNAIIHQFGVTEPIKLRKCRIVNGTLQPYVLPPGNTKIEKRQFQSFKPHSISPNVALSIAQSDNPCFSIHAETLETMSILEARFIFENHTKLMPLSRRFLVPFASTTHQWDPKSMGFNVRSAKRHASHFCRCLFRCTGQHYRLLSSFFSSFVFSHSAAIMLSSVLSIQYKKYMYIRIISYFLHKNLLVHMYIVNF